MTAALRDRQHARLCDVLDAVPADAPTLCAGWDAHDLAVHVWSLSHDPLSWPGAAVPALAPLTERRAARLRRRWPYPRLVAMLRADDPGLACMPADRLDGHRHALGEYYVHTQDVARANHVAQPAPDADLEDALWRRALAAARALHWNRLGLVLERPEGTAARVTPGRTRLVVRGLPSELICWVHGRVGVADVQLDRR